MSKNKRYEYWEESDTAYDTKITYGQYFRIIDKKDMVYLLNEKEERIKELENKLNWQERETTELQERNDRQYQQLTHLHKLIDKQEWETLTKEREQMKEEDKRLLELENIPVRCMRIYYGE